MLCNAHTTKETSMHIDRAATQVSGTYSIEQTEHAVGRTDEFHIALNATHELLSRWISSAGKPWWEMTINQKQAQKIAIIKYNENPRRDIAYLTHIYKKRG